jgi:hypothetical protein
VPAARKCGNFVDDVEMAPVDNGTDYSYTNTTTLLQKDIIKTFSMKLTRYIFIRIKVTW